MKKLLYILLFCFLGFITKAQIPADSSYLTKQNLGKTPTTIVRTNAMSADDGFINASFTDTTAANMFAQGGKIKFYPGAQIFTTSDSSIWIRNSTANAWLRGGGGGITNIFNNSTTTINNFGDTALIVCTGVGNAQVCDTIFFQLDSINNFYFLNDSTIVACDTPQVITVGDSSYTQQLCDTITIPRAARLVLQNGVQFVSPGIGEHGSVNNGPNPSQLQKDTYLYTDFYQYGITGAPYLRPTLYVQNKQWTSISQSVVGFNSLGNNIYFRPTQIDNENPVNLYLNYIDPMAEGNGVFAGDTIGAMYDRIGYAWMTNAQGTRAGFSLQSPIAKQSGIMFHTFDTAYTDGVTIFANQTPNPYLFSVSPFPTTTLLDSRIATFRTNKDITFQGYPDTRDDGPTNVVLYPDEDGNLLVGGVQGGSTINIINDTTLLICSNNRGQVSCDTVTINNVTNPSVINIFNDTTIIICNEAGSCDTIIVNNFNILGQQINVGNTLFVSKAGNDATGVRQRLDLHFLTIRGALNAAMAGDVIVVYPGTYEETSPLSLAKSVNYHFIGKGELRLNTSVASGALFTDSATVCYSKIWAEHWTFNARSSQRAFNQTAASTLYIVADSIVSDQGRTINTSGSARTTIKANYMYTNGTLGGSLWIAGAYFYGDVDVIQENQFGSAVWISNVPSFTLHSKRIFTQNLSHAEYLVHITDSNPTDSILITADELYSQLEWTIWAEGECKNVYVQAQRISSNSDCTVTSSLISGGLMTVEADIIETRKSGTIDGIIHGEGGGLRVRGAVIKRPSGNTTGADVKVRNFGGNQGSLDLIAVSYDQRYVSENLPGYIKRIDSLYYGSQFRMNEARFEFDSTNIVAANDLNLTKGNLHVVSGNTQINAIFTQGWQPGSFVLLEFTGTPTVKDGTSGGAGTAQIQLAGNTDFVAAAGDVLTLEYNGTYWREAARALAASAGGVTADNGLTANTATNVRLFGTIGTPATLLDSRYLDQSTFELNQTGTTSGFLVNYNNGTGNGLNLTTDGISIQAISASSLAIYGESTFDAGVEGKSPVFGMFAITNSDNGVGLQATNSINIGAAGGAKAILAKLFATNNTTVPIIEINRRVLTGGGTPASNIGGSIDFTTATTTDATGQLSNQIISKWTTATHASRTSQLDITGVNSGTTQDLVSFDGDGTAKFYGLGGSGVTPTAIIRDAANGTLSFGRPVPNGNYLALDSTGSIALIQAKSGAYFEINGSTDLFHVVLQSGFNFLSLDANSGVYDIGDISSFGSGNNTYLRVDDANQRVILNKRFLQKQGTDVSSTGTLSLQGDGNVFELTGTADVNTISNVSWQNGSVVILQFTSTAKLKNGQATSGTDITILLSGAADFTGSANDTITLVLGEIGGTQAWREVSRSVN